MDGNSTKVLLGCSTKTLEHPPFLLALILLPSVAGEGFSVLFGTPIVTVIGWLPSLCYYACLYILLNCFFYTYFISNAVLTCVLMFRTSGVLFGQKSGIRMFSINKFTFAEWYLLLNHRALPVSQRVACGNWHCQIEMFMEICGTLFLVLPAILVGLDFRKGMTGKVSWYRSSQT